MRKTIYLLFALTILLGLVASSAGAQQAPLNVEQRLVDTLARDGKANFFVKMSAVADLSAAYTTKDWTARGQFVVDALQKVATESQKAVIEYAQKNGLDYTSFITTNAVFIRGGNLQNVLDFAALVGVSLVRQEQVIALPDPFGGVGINGIVGPQPAAAPDATTDWGITDTKADQVWMLGVRGAGIKVANIDTGVQWDHPALVNQFACPGAPTDAKCWSDPSNICGAGGACDNAGHGTHTMGTMVAKDDPALAYIAGMAPDSTWIACKGCESSSCSEFALNTCADWILAPGGNVANRPDVVNNSWGGGGGDNWYQAKVVAWRAAGIFPAFSAGNSGSSCNTLGSPGDYQESFASAAHSSNRVIASFSSRGPSAFGHDPYTKPNISAPGVSVCSSIPGSSWSCGYSGTSMASPHTAGAVALIWSACPALKGNMDATFLALQNTADLPPVGTCGAPPDGQGNYTYGYGYLNALAAVQSCFSGGDLGTLQGHVLDTLGNPIEGAAVTASPATESGQIQATTDPTGFYTMDLVAGAYDVTASKYGFETQTHLGVVVASAQTTVEDFALVSVPVWLPGTPTTFDFYRLDSVFNPDDGLIYFLGGRLGQTPDKNIFTYDPATQVTVDTGIDMLFNISNYTIALIPDDGTGRGTALYVVGGYDATTAANIDKVQRFYPGLGLVESVETDLYPDKVAGAIVGASGVAAVDGKIYVFGGWESATAPYFSDKTWVFDPMAAAGARWTNLNCPLTPARSYVNTAVVGTKIYALGGDAGYVASDLVPTDSALVFDTANPTGCWSAIAPLPVATSQGRGYGKDADTQSGGTVYVVGGGDWPAASGDVYAYDIDTNTWSSDLPAIGQPRRNFAGSYVSTCTDDPTDPFPSMWVFGGYTSADAGPYGTPEYYPLACAGGAPTLHVQEISFKARFLRGKYVVRTSVFVVDQSGAIVNGAATSVDMTYPNGLVKYYTQLTNVLGNALFMLKSPWNGTWTLCVDNIAMTGYTYDPLQNLETCDSYTFP